MGSSDCDRTLLVCAAAHRPPKARIEALRTSFICRESGAVAT